MCKKYELINATNKDIEQLIKYKYKNILEYAIDINDEEKKEIDKYIKEHVVEEIKQYKMIEVNNKKIGCLLVTKKDDGILLDEIYLENEYRNMGIGSNIISNILLNNNIIYLWVYKLNKKALSLYNRLGFEIIQETNNRYYMKCITDFF